MAPWPAFVLAGVAIGALTGFFGVGGSSVATPLLAALGVPPLLAIASPLPATIPTALTASVPYVTHHEVRPRAAAWTLAGALPATIVGSLLSGVIGGPRLLITSGLALVLVGVRVLRPISEAARIEGTLRRKNRFLLLLASAGVGLFSGMLANGGGFMLVPMYLLLFGMPMRESAGTSLVVVAVLAIPTLATHAALGHIDWGVAAAFALGMVPAGAVCGHFAQRVVGSQVRHAFGWFLVASGVAFVAYRLAR